MMIYEIDIKKLSMWQLTLAHKRQFRRFKEHWEYGKDHKQAWYDALQAMWTERMHPGWTENFQDICNIIESQGSSKLNKHTRARMLYSQVWPRNN